VTIIAGATACHLLQRRQLSLPASAIEKMLFPDQATLEREETRRWDLTEDHWDLPIRQTDPNASE
jgi:hypothetical protein